MAQLGEVHVSVRMDMSAARRSVKRVLALAGEANRELAQLEEKLDRFREELAEYGITLEVSE